MTTKRIWIVVALVPLALLLVTASLWYYRPWSDYSPARIASLTKPEALPENFRHMDRFFPSRPVTAPQQTRALPGQSQPLSLSYRFGGTEKTLAQFLEESRTMGLLVLKDGEIVHERYLMGSDERSYFTSWSVAKSVVATAINMALKEGRIHSLDDPVQRYAPQFTGSGFADVSLRALLQMSSGVAFNEDYNADNSDIRPYFFNTFILGKNADQLLLPFQRSRDPFTDFDYLSPNSHVLSSVLRGVYQKPLAEIITEKVWQPLGMEFDAYWLQNRPGDAGLALGYCCLNARLRDYARFGQFYLEAFHGEGVGVKLLPAEWAPSLNKPASDSHVSGGEKYQGRGYSQHFWLPPEPRGEFMAAGVYGQYVFIDPDKRVVIARNSADPEWTERQQESAVVMQAIVDAVSEEAP
ncbi:MAG: serine hydrolase [Alcanivoracaceae bacterium]|nr:serine hydrolase [Alcanivoracaceae bacterium]